MKLKIDKPSVREKIDKIKLRFRYFWQSQSPQKKQAYVLLSMIFVVMIISSFYPKFVFSGLLTLSLYLFWTLYNK